MIFSRALTTIPLLPGCIFQPSGAWSKHVQTFSRSEERTLCLSMASCWHMTQHWLKLATALFLSDASLLTVRLAMHPLASR